MIGLLYYGRLEKEKGFDAVIKLIAILPQTEFFIFGTGSLASQLLPLTQQAHVHYFGRQPLEKIQSYLQNIDYCLMPSECLESFGLSALNALSRGIPVIGYKKGGLEPFILPAANLFAYKGKNTTERLTHCIEKLHDTGAKRSGPSSNGEGISLQTIQNMITSYTSTVRYENFLKLCGKQIPQKIVLVSDFINQFGGIETYLHEVKSLLESQGHHVLLRGGRMPKGSLGRIKMWRGLITAPVNVWSAWSFKHFLKKEKPDLIRFHSLLRNLGPNVVRVAQGEKIKTWMMYHDLGYFTPYPSKISAVSEIHTPLTLQHFLANVKGRIINKIAVFCKYFWLKKLIRVLKAAVDLHLVPSAFMEPFVVQGRGIPEKHVKVLPHFLQK